MEKILIANEITKGILLRREGNYLGYERFFGMKGISYFKRPIQETDLHPETLGTFFLNTDVDRTEGDKLIVEQFTATETGYTCRMVDETGTFAVETVMKMDPETGIFSRKDTLENLDAIPHTIYACQARFPLHGDDFEIYAQTSGWCSENEGEWHRFTGGNFELTNSAGRTTDTANPFLCIRQASTGFAAAIHVLPVGDWMIKVRRQAGHRTTFAVIEAGLSNQGLHMEIAPGERLVLPELLLQGFTGEISSAAPLLHRYILNRWPKKPLTAPLYNTWFLDFDTIELDRLKRQVQIAADLGCKYYVVDAGWFGEGDSWWDQVGYWQERLDGAFCGKLREFSDYVRQHGLLFGIWLEIERAAPNSHIYKEKPEYFRRCDSIQYDLLNPEVEDYLVNQLVDVVNRYDVRWIKIDYNSNYFRDLHGDNFYRYFQASDRMMKRAREACPQTIFEGCSAGGRRTVILQTMEKSALHFISDTANPSEVIRMRHNAALRLPPQYLSTWSVLAESPFHISSYTDRNRMERRKLFVSADAEWSKILDVSVDYSAATTFAGCPGFSGDLETLSEATLARFRKWIEVYNANADFLTRCVCHLLTAPTKIDDINGWSVMQYENMDGEGSLIYAYRLNGDVDVFPCYPKNLDFSATYCIETFDGETTEISGRELSISGLEIKIKDYYDATLLKLRKL